MVAVTYGIRPYGGARDRLGQPARDRRCCAAAWSAWSAFAVIERRVADPMFRLELFRIRAFTFGSIATFLSAVARGGLMFMLIIWLQGIWLPQHGYDFTKTPLWAGIYMLPLTIGMLLAGPTSGLPLRPLRRAAVRHRRDARRGRSASSLLELLPTDFAYPAFALVLLLNGVSMGLFASPNRAAVMNSLPRGDRGAGGGMNQTFQNSAQVLSIGIFFTLMIIGLARQPAGGDDERPARPTASPRPPRTQRRPPAAGLDPVRRVPRLQPDPAPARPACRSRAHAPRPRGADRPLVLPAPDLGAVPRRAARGVRVRDHRLPAGGCGVADAWRPIPPRR